MINKVQTKRGTSGPGTTLDVGELGWDTTNKKLYVGNGIGKSATQVAATGATGTGGSRGYTGATGYKGATGEAGLKGATGTNGAAGDKGTTGANGTRGPNGTKGANGTKGGRGPGMTKTLLWTNSSPTSNFAAQTTTTSSNPLNYDHLLIEYYNTSGDTAIQEKIFFDLKQGYYTLQSCGSLYTGGSWSSFWASDRGFDITTSGLKFYTAFYKWSTDVNWGYEGNHHLIPYKIYGIKIT